MQDGSLPISKAKAISQRRNISNFRLSRYTGKNRETGQHATTTSSTTTVCLNHLSYTPFTRHNRLSNRFYNRFDNRLFRVNKHPTGCQTGLYNRIDNRFDNRLYRVNGALRYIYVTLHYTIHNSLADSATGRPVSRIRYRHFNRQRKMHHKMIPSSVFNKSITKYHLLVTNSC